MYKGNNQTALNSMNWFANSLVKLMENIEYRNILVRMLCKEADLSRQTFYNLFSDKDEVLLYYLENSAMEHFKEINLNENIQVDFFVKAFASYIDEHEKFLKKLSENHLEHILQQAIVNDLNIIAKTYANHNPNRYAQAFLSGALTQVIICWIYDKNRITTYELANIIKKILVDNYYKI